MQKIVKNIFFILVILSLLAPLWTFKGLLFPYVTSKAFYFRILIETAVPFYIYLLAIFPRVRPTWKKHYLNWFVLLFLIFNIISAFTGVGTTRSLWGNFERMGGAFYLAHLTALYFYILALGQMGGGYLKWFLNSFLAVALIVTINGIFGKLGLPTLVLDPSLPTRVSSTLGNPIYLGSYLVVPLFLTLYLSQQAEGKFKTKLYYFFSFLFLTGLVLSGTRGAMVGLIAGIFLSAVIYIVLSPKKQIKIFGSMVVVVFVAAYILLSTFSAGLPQGSNLQRLFKLKDGNTQARLIQWGVALTGYKDYPLFGVGPENYYVIANKYYNPEIFKYDRSWFDKPHNYLLEILVTTGLVGFLTYLAILVAVILALYRGYTNGALNLFEFCVLLAGLLVYQIQNLTVFDTVPASLTLYSFMGFVGYILFTSQNKLPYNVKTAAKTDKIFPLVAGGTGLLLMSYVIYAANVTPMRISSYINYGYAYAGVDQAKADDFFQKAISLPFNFDKTQTAQKYSEFSTNFSHFSSGQNQALADKVNDESIVALNDALYYEPKYPILWQELGSALLFKNYKNGRLTSLDSGVFDALNTAVDLVPEREEPYLSLAQAKGVSGDIAGAESILTKLVEKFPGDPNAKIQLAAIERLKQNVDEAVRLTLEAQKNGYSFSSYDTIKWIIDYYADKKDFQTALSLMEQAQKSDPNNILVYEDLARLYLKSGQLDLARNLAVNIMNTVTSTRPQMQELIDSIQKQKIKQP